MASIFYIITLRLNNKELLYICLNITGPVHLCMVYNKIYYVIIDISSVFSFLAYSKFYFSIVERRS